MNGWRGKNPPYYNHGLGLLISRGAASFCIKLKFPPDFLLVNNTEDAPTLRK